jgi:hypothetical protein
MTFSIVTKVNTYHFIIDFFQHVAKWNMLQLSKLMKYIDVYIYINILLRMFSQVMRLDVNDCLFIYSEPLDLKKIAYLVFLSRFRGGH